MGTGVVWLPAEDDDMRFRALGCFFKLSATSPIKNGVIGPYKESMGLHSNPAILSSEGSAPPESLTAEARMLGYTYPIQTSEKRQTKANTTPRKSKTKEHHWC